MRHPGTPAAATAAAIDHLVTIGQSLRQLHGIKGGAKPWVDLDVTMPQLKTLFLVVVSGGTPSGDLARRLGVRPSAVTPLVDRLIELRLARREDDPDDRRIVWVKPTPRAVELHAQLLQASRSVVGEVLQEVPASERMAVARALGVLAEAAARVLARRQEEVAV